MAFDKVVTFNPLKNVLADHFTAALQARELKRADGKSYVVAVFTNDPMDWADFPCICINQLGHSEAASHIGDAMADEYLESEHQFYAGIVAEFSQQVEVKVWALSADERDFLGDLAAVILVEGRGTSAAPGVLTTTPGISNCRIGGGHDEGISDTSGEYSPHPVFMRTFILTATVELAIQEPAGAAIAEVIPFGEMVHEDVFADL